MNIRNYLLYIGITFLFIPIEGAYGQNLIPNGSFEDISMCPDDHGQIDRAIGWSNPSGASPDLFNSCAGFGPCVTCVPFYSHLGSQNPRTGESFVGIFTLWLGPTTGGIREYLRTELTQILTAGETYEFTMYINFADACETATSAPQVHFSTDNYSHAGNRGFFTRTPQIDFDTLITERFEWVKLTACYVAEGGERYVTIGNFLNSNDTEQQFLGSNDERHPYYIMDDISLTLQEEIPADLLPGDTTICEGDSIVIDLPDHSEFLWSDGSTENRRSIKRTGLYQVISTSECAIPVGDTFFVRVNNELNLNLPDSVFLCENGQVVLRPGGRIDRWLWSDGSTADSFLVDRPGEIWVEAENNCGIVRDTIPVAQLLDPRGSLQGDTTICAGDTLWLTADPSLNPIWEGNIQSDSFMVTEGGLIILELSNFCGSVMDFIRVEQLERPEIELSNVMDFCEGDSVQIIPEIVADEWMWIDNFPDSLRWIKNEGWYGVSATTECGTITDSFYLRELTGPFLGLPKDTILCDGQEWEINLTGVQNVRWNDGSTDLNYTISSAGLYWVEATNECGQIRDSIDVSYIAAPTVELGEDTTICPGDTIILFYNGQDDWLWSDGSTSRQMMVTGPGSISIEVFNDCGSITDIIRIESAENIMLQLPDSIELCEGQTENIVPTTNSATWIWSDGTVDGPKKISGPGLVWARAENACGVAADTTFVLFNELPNWAELTPDATICPGDTITLFARTDEDDLIIWRSENVMGPILHVNQAGRYEVSASNDCGEVVEEIIVESRDCGCQVYVPNTFSPNGDNINDQLEVFAGCELENLSLEVYSRWGELIFRSEEGQLFWDGTFQGEQLSPDVFVYTASYSIGGFSHLKSGSVTLIR